MIINHNLGSMNALAALNSNSGGLQKALQQLSSGLRINSAADDAAGLAISEKMKGQISGLNQASRNAQDGISLIQTAEGAMNETHSILQRMRELAVQSSNDTNTSSDRKNIQQEVDQLSKEITRISNTTEFNTQNLLAGGLNDTFQIGANQGQNINLTVGAMDAQSLGVARNINEVTSFSAGLTTLSSSAVGNADLGSGITAGTWSIVDTHNAATTTINGDTLNGGVASLTAGGSYTGASDQANVQFKVTAVDGSNKISAAQYSTDGGTTWNAATVSAADVITYNGATLTSTSDNATDVGKTITASFTAKYDSLQLENPSLAPVGAAVKAYQGETSVVIGDSTSNQTVTVNSSSLGSLTSGTATFNVAAQQSTAATIGANNTVTAQAVTQAGVDVSTQAAANSAITKIDNAIQSVSNARAQLGAYENRLDHTINNLSASSQSLTSAQSRITDVDMAQEMATFTKDNVLQQAAVSMLAQANQQPQLVLKLLG